MLDVRAATVTEEMKLAAAEAIAGVITEDELHADYIVPSVFDRRVSRGVAEAVSAACPSQTLRRCCQPSTYGKQAALMKSVPGLCKNQIAPSRLCAARLTRWWSEPAGQ